jgi:hypothetical protein
MRVLLEDASFLAGNLAPHLRAKIETRLELVLYEIDQ